MKDKNYQYNNDYIGFYYSRNWEYKHAMFEIEYRPFSRRNIAITFAIPYLFYVGLKFKFFKFGKKEIIVFHIAFHNRAFWWNFCTPKDEWHASTPRWRKGAFHFQDFFFGKPTCSTEVVEERDVLVPMPEKSYQATAQLVRYTWSRPRWFDKVVIRCEIKVKEGIPHEGKGENSWDCGPDATYSMTTGECRSIAEGVGRMVGSILRDRVKYGGYKDWSWSK